MPDRTVVVGVGSAIGPDNMARLAAADERIRVVDLAPTLYALHPPAFRAGQTMPPPPADGATLDGLAAQARDIEVLLARSVPPSFWGMAPALKWVQAATAGADWFIEAGIRSRPDVTLATAAGFNAVAVSEWALMAMLALCKQMPRLLEAQRQRAWLRADLEEMDGKTVGIVGLGQIGRRIAALCRPFGMRVLGLRRNVAEPVDAVDELLPPERLGDLLERSDFVVLAAPLTEATRGLIDAAALRRMRPAAFLINLARGPLVDEAALLQALRDGVIAGAALDVVNQEPLPRDNPLWEAPNLLLTGHVAGLTRKYDRRMTDCLIENLTRWLRGEPLQGAVDWERGY